MNYRRVIYVAGLLIATISTTMIAPLLVALGYGEQETAAAFGYSIGIGFAVALVAILWGRHADKEFFRRDGLAVVGTAWIFCTLVGCLPYILTGVIPSFVDAYFETMSGFTTTGASILSDIEFMPNGEETPLAIQFWRCMTNWLGGVGIVVLFVALLPALGVGSRLLFHFEVPGLGEKGFMPHIRQTATTLWVIYFLLTACQTLFLRIAGVDWFYAVCHSFSTLATGGFSPHNTSIGHYDSTAVHLIVTFFMFLAGINFTLYFRISSGGWAHFFKNREFLIYLGMTVLAIAVITLDLSLAADRDDTGIVLRDSAFQVTSIATTTGFGTADFDTWPALSKLVLILLMFVGGCAGSTAGGMKVIRIAILFKYMLRQVKTHIMPRNVDRIRIGADSVTPELIRQVIGMALLFVTLFVIGAVALAALGSDLTTSLSASIASLGNIGPGLGAVGPTCNYAELSDASKLVCTMLMLIGRLEVFTALSLFTSILWRE